MGIFRSALDGVDGYFAIHLWNDYYYNGNRLALETLLAYNIEDTVNLEKLMEISFNKKIDRIGIKNFETVNNNQSPKNPFQPHLQTLLKIKSRLNFKY